MLYILQVFIFFKRNFYRANKFIRHLSQYSFGAYLVHDEIIIQVTRRIGLNAFSFNPVISVPVIALIVFVISFVISAVINNIPVLKKYIV